MSDTIRSAALYIRVSTEQQKDGDSLREQQETLQEYAKQKGYVVHSIYIDDGVSGQKLNRSEFQRLMQDVEARKIDIILFTKLDRWFRSMRHYLNTQATLKKYGVAWTAVRQDYYDTTTAYGRAFVQQSMIWAELEAQNTSDRIKAVFENKAANGEVLSGEAPIGYKIENKHLVPNDDAWKVRALFEHYNAHNSMNAAVRYCNDELGISMKQSNIKLLYSNTKYIGLFRGNPNYCPPLVDKELFESVQRKLAMNVKSDCKHDYIFASMIRCSECGWKMGGTQISNTRVLKNGEVKRHQYSSYRCAKAYPARHCPNRIVARENTVEKRLIAQFQADIKRELDILETQKKEQVDSGKRKAALEKKISRIKDLYVDGVIERDEMRNRISALEKEINELVEVVDIKSEEKRLRELLDIDFDGIYKELLPEEKRNFWRALVKEIIFHPDKSLDIIFL